VGIFFMCRNRIHKVSIIFQIFISQNMITKKKLVEDSIQPILVI